MKFCLLLQWNLENTTSLSRDNTLDMLECPEYAVPLKTVHSEISGLFRVRGHQDYDVRLSQSALAIVYGVFPNCCCWLWLNRVAHPYAQWQISQNYSKDKGLIQLKRGKEEFVYMRMSLMSTPKIQKYFLPTMGWLLAEAVAMQKGLTVSVITVMWTSQTEASEPQLVR